MRINLSPKGKTVAAISLIGLALLIAGWTMARNPKAEVTVPPSVQQPAAAVAVVVSQDNPLVKKVYAALAKKSQLKGENIKVEPADGGKVILSGKASNPTKQALALQVAEKTAGKTNVIHKLSTNCGSQSCDPPNHCCNCDPQGQGCVCQQNPCTHLKKSAKSKKTN